MSRVWLIPVVVLVSVLAPSVGRAQYAVVSPCGDDCARVSVIPAPPTGVPAWLQPRVVAPPALPPPAVYVAPVSPGRGLDPWIPLAGRPALAPTSGDVLTQMLLLQQLAAARQPRPAIAPPAPAPAPVVPAPTPRRAPEDHWMSAFIKPVNPAPEPSDR